MGQSLRVQLQNTNGQTSFGRLGLLLNLDGKMLYTPIKLTPEGTQPALEGAKVSTFSLCSVTVWIVPDLQSCTLLEILPEAI